MIVLSLFDGMSCGQIALIEEGFKIDKYYASETDKHAIWQTQHVFPNTIQLGSVCDIKAKDLDKIDLLIGGSPCQGFSFAGKQLNFDDPRSALFFEFVRIWKEIKAINPDAKFLLENVNMKKEHLRVISEYMGVFPVNLNSNRVSAQNRDRWYWTNIKTKKVGLFDELYSDIPLPKDEKLLLKDILEPDYNIDEKYYLSEKMLNYCINNSEKMKMKNHGFSFNPKSGNEKSFAITTKEGNRMGDNFIKVEDQAKSVFDSVDSVDSVRLSKNNMADVVCVAMRGRKQSEKGEYTQKLEPTNNHKTNAITTVSKDNLILERTNASYVQLDISGKNHKSQQDRFFFEDKKHGTLPSARADTKNGVAIRQTLNGYRLRRLIPAECAALQTVPKWYKWIVSDTQIYKMLGNGFTVKMIQHITSFIDKTEIK